MSMSRCLKAVAAGLAGLLALGSGLAAAGALPGAAQGTAHDWLESLGVSVPDPDGNAGDNPHSRGSSVGATTAATAVASSGIGDSISDLAHTTDADGVDKGAARKLALVESERLQLPGLDQVVDKTLPQTESER